MDGIVRGSGSSGGVVADEAGVGDEAGGFVRVMCGGEAARVGRRERGRSGVETKDADMERVSRMQTGEMAVAERARRD
jgi:hypothetical protein